MRIENKTKIYLFPIAMLVASALFVISVEVWAADAASATGCHSFDMEHTAFTSLLSSHVRNGKVNYAGLKKNKALLENYLKELESVCTADFSKFKKKEKLAFFINAYNAYTLKVVVDNYPTKSIKKIGSNPNDAWTRKIVSLKNLFGKSISLHHLENQVIRTRFKDARIHFGLVCASKGCPSLLSKAYTGKNVVSLLNRNTKKFVADKRWNQYDPSRNTLYLSKIFEWYANDFGGKQKLVTFFAKYAPKDVAASLETAIRNSKSPKLVFKEYDWSLNE